MRLRRADPAAPGYRRRRRGRGFSYSDTAGQPITDPAELGRIRALVIPPAWRNVWICPDPRGHIQAIGVDQAGRRQYRYHDAWRVKQDAAKFDHVLDVAERLPVLRDKVSRDLTGRGLSRERILATATRLLDRGVFRIGGEAYASADSAGEASYGLATLHREHVCVRGVTITFQYPAKGGIERVQALSDPQIAPVVRALLRRRDEHPELLAYRLGTGWRDVRSTDINEYLRAASGCAISAKDFRTWHATVLAAAALALPTAVASSRTGRRRAVSRAIREVAEYLGNTPTVARASYVDPRVIDLYHDGTTIAGALPAGVTEERLGDLIGEPAVEDAVRELVR